MRVRAMGRGVLLLVPEIALTPAVADDIPRARSATASRSSTAGSPTASVTTSGNASGAATSTSSSARGRPCSRRSRMPGLDHRGRRARRIVQAGRESALSTAATSPSMRAQHAGALVVLGSATPSLESYYNAQNGRYALSTLERRVLDRPLRDGAGRRHARGVRCRGA